METFKIIYTMLGGLGIFFYGLKMMSESLQSMAGDVIRKVINSLTSNRLLAVVVGVIVTMIVQSSSVTTVMVVGFVNAGLMSLTQSIGVIFGANIGTTITGWIISIKVGKYGLLFIGLGVFPALFSKAPRWKNIGTVVVGVGLIFLGLETMSEAFKPLRTNQSFLESISYFAGTGYLNYAASILMGCILTMVIQSSSAMLGITIALATTGIIGFNTAAALVFGENIGTTITALLASVGANINARRAAMAHATFNLIGVSIMFIILPWYLDLVESLIPGVADFVSADGSKPYIAAHIAASHSIFNISATLLFIPFLNVLARFVIAVVPDRGVGKDTHHLVVLGNASDILPATAIVQAHEEIKKFKEIIDRMYSLTREFMSKEKIDAKLLAKIRGYERITDNIQKEVTVFLSIVMEKPLSQQQSQETQALIRIADEYESVADYLERTATYRVRGDQEFLMKGELRDGFLEYMQEVWNFVNLCSQGLYEGSVHDNKLYERKSEKLRAWADTMRDKHIDRISKGEYDPLSALIYSDMVVAIRKIRAHALNVAQAIDGLRERDT